MVVDDDAGSSPLARGLPVSQAWHQHHARIIPARAGFTRSSRASSARSTDHPRSRGVYHRIIWRPGASRRIIPARAGFTVRPREAPAQGPDHPRSRGVYMSRRRKSTPVIGSSPLARGLLSSHVRASDDARIIPARAGFTHLRDRSPGRPGDHPRSRGVYPPYGAITRACVGSSPLARGLQRAVAAA